MEIIFNFCFTPYFLPLGIVQDVRSVMIVTLNQVEKCMHLRFNYNIVK